MVRFISIFVGALELSSVLAQQPFPATLNQTSQQMKDRLIQIGIGNRLTVWEINGEEYHGILQTLESQMFTMQEVDLKTTETIPYDEVKKVSKNYGGKTISGRHMSYRKQWLGWVIGTAAIFTLIIVTAVELGKA